MTSTASGSNVAATPADAGAPAADVPSAGTPSAGAPSMSGDGDLERLRELLFGDELREIEAARARIAAIEGTQGSLSRRLPPALEEASAGSDAPRVARALATPVASALATAVRDNRQGLVDALFPVIGPLIRKSIAEALRNLVADLNGAIESSFTPRGLKWRLEAWRAGVPYAQVVLKHRLAYEIDHVFLIARESGLVLHHESAPALPELDKDAIAGMLTALGDFVGDSVGGGDGGALESVRVGEHLVWFLHGPRANLACFIRGVPPPALYGLLEQRIEEIHSRFDLDGGADAPGAAAFWHESLQPLALTRQAAPEGVAARKPPSMLPLLALVLALAVALFAFLVSRERWQARVDALRGRLEAHPGFVLGGIDASPWRRLVVRGLLDPDAEPLAPLLHDGDFGGVVPRLDVQGYLSGADAVVERRARRLLQPPAGVDVAAKAGVLALSGAAAPAWIERATERAAWIAGVARVESTLQPAVDAAAAARAELAELARTLPSTMLTFTGDVQPAADAADVADAIAATARRAAALARTAGLDVRLTCVGTNSREGSDTGNESLRARRAQWLAQALAERGVRGADGGELATAGDAGVDRRGAYLRLSIGEGR